MKLSNFLKLCLTKIDNLSKKLVVFLIIFYKRAISVHFPPTCRYIPTCSTYAMQAFKKYNFFKALYLSVKRILRCHPFRPGGYDPLP